MGRANKILLLVEGEIVEVALFNHLYHLYNLNEVEIVPYKTNLYAFYHRLLKDYAEDGVINFDLIDIPLFLNEYFNLSDEELLNETDFTDIILIFDFDPHDPNFSKEKIKILLENYTESSDKGKIYINYPMIESFRDIEDMDNEELFYNLKVSKEELINRHRGSSSYKKIVDERSCIPKIINITLQQFNDIVFLHENKLKRLLPHGGFEEQTKYLIFCDVQCHEYTTNNSLWVLNTSILHMIDQYGILNT